METERAEGIVLRVHPVTESSLIVTWFTREAGKVKTMAKGARRPKSPFRGKIDLFYRDEIVFLRSKRSDLHLLHECFLETAHARLRGSVESLAGASYVAELVDLITETEDPNREMFELLAVTLRQLEKIVSGALVLWFELRLLSVAGWRPRWETGKTVSKVLGSLAGAKIDGAGRVRLTGAQLAEARQSVWNFWDAEVTRVPRTRKFFAEQIRH